jgi:hypothetical protein
MAALLTINVPLILKMRDFMFFKREKHIISHFEGFFEGAETFEEKLRPPQKTPRNG